MSSTPPPRPSAGPPRPTSAAIKGKIGKPEKAKPSSTISKPEGLSRPTATGCLEAVTQAMNLLEKREKEGRLEDYGVHVESVVDLRDKLELYMLTAAPGDSFRPTEADITAAEVAATLLEQED